MMPPPMRYVVADLTFVQAVFGATVPVTLRTAAACADCNGTGAGHGTQPVTCSECNGAGQVQRVRQSLLGQMVTSSPCPRCNGLGQVVVTPCPTCRGEGRVTVDKTYQVDVPAGVDSGSTLRLTGRGAAGPRGGKTGDLYVHLRVKPHDRFERVGHDLLHVLKLPKAHLYAGILIFATVGVYGMRQSAFDLVLLYGIGLLGVVMRRFDFPTAPVVVGMILGPLAEAQRSEVQIFSVSADDDCV